MCSAYLWKDTLDGRHVARVVWETVTIPKDEGGLGIRNLIVWNQTCAIKLLWFLLFKTELSGWPGYIKMSPKIKVFGRLKRSSPLLDI